MEAHWMFLTLITDKERSTVAGMDHIDAFLWQRWAEWVWSNVTLCQHAQRCVCDSRRRRWRLFAQHSGNAACLVFVFQIVSCLFKHCSCVKVVWQSLSCYCDVLFYYCSFVPSFFIILPFAVHFLTVWFLCISVTQLLCLVLYKLVSSEFAWLEFVFLFLCHEK